MRILRLTMRDHLGGAAETTYLLHRALVELGVDDTLLVRYKKHEDDTILTVGQVGGKIAQLKSVLAYLLDRRPVRLYPHLNMDRYFSINWFPAGISRCVQTIAPDIVHLHWIGQGFVPVAALPRFKRPLVWTLHDWWAFTGGCYLPYDCKRYQSQCGCCPVLGSSHERDISRWNWQQKQTHWQGLDLTIVAPSKGLAESARQSSLFRNARIELIPHGLSLETYHPIDKHAARAALNLPLEKKLILFGAVASTRDHNKGFHLLQPALHQLAAKGWSQKAELIVFGNQPDAQPDEVALDKHYLGHITDEKKKALLYAAADVFVIPSIQEALGRVVMEAMACGTPCVGFRIGGISDLIEHQINGYLAEPYEVEDLANGIAWILEDDERHSELSMHGAAKIRREHSLPVMAKRYAALYDEILTERGLR